MDYKLDIILNKEYRGFLEEYISKGDGLYKL